ncbi:hypothetical protein HNP69_001662 [Chryseobacterium koreense]|nr:hypothetical protein [Chryseobacterium koreense]
MPVSTVFADKGSYCRKGRFLPNLPKMTGFADLYFNAFSCFMVGDEWGLTGRWVGASVPYRFADCKFRYCYPPHIGGIERLSHQRLGCGFREWKRIGE